MLFFIKYFSIILCSFYSFHKIINCPIKSKQRLPYIIFSFILGILASVIEHLNPYCTILLILLFSFIFLIYTQKLTDEVIMNATIISYGISAVTFSISSLLITFLTLLFSSYGTYSHAVAQIITAMIQILITYALYLPKRFKKGMPFLTNKLNSTTLLTINLMVLFIFLILSDAKSNISIFITLYFIVFLFAITIYLNWRNNLTRTYMDKIRERDIQNLNTHLDELELQLKEMEADKDGLAKLIHADNKLIPMMALAVESYLQDASDNSPEKIARGDELLEKLHAMTEDRKGILRIQDSKCTAKLPDTGISSLNDILIYMRQKAFEHNMELMVTADADVRELINSSVQENDLVTMIADLLDNAIIANGYCDGHRILFSIGRVEKYLNISIFDSGIPFAKEVLVDLGVRGHTTHKDDGGSGIGLMTVYELVRKYHASLVIEEYHAAAALYTKRIAVLFNKRGNYILNTSRPKEEISFLRRRRDLTIIEKKEPVMR